VPDGSALIEVAYSINYAAVVLKDSVGDEKGFFR